jgi:hypothetical protein
MLKEEEERRRRQREVEQQQQQQTGTSSVGSVQNAQAPLQQQQPAQQKVKPQIDQEEIKRLREMEKVFKIL